MLVRLLLLTIFCIFSVRAAIRCYEGMQTVPGVGTPFQETFCPNSDFCFNNYVKRHHNGDDSYTLSKSCGQPGKCFEVGCDGPIDERRCCCAGDLCNSSNGLNLATAGIITIIYANLH